MAKCVHCGTEIVIIDRIGRLDDCEKCGRDLHACVQCSLFDRGYHNDCRESQSGYIGDKERANFCEFFQFGRDIEDERNTVAAMKNKLNDLFK